MSMSSLLAVMPFLGHKDASEGMKEVPFAVQVLLFLRLIPEIPVEGFIDNVGAIQVTENPGASSRTRHVDARRMYLNDLQEQGLVKLKFVRSADNPSDIATKNVNGDTFGRHVVRFAMDKGDLEG